MSDVFAVPVVAANGNAVLVEVSPSVGMRAALLEGRDQARMQDLVETIEGFAAPLRDVATNLKPKTFTLTFGVTLTAETGQLPQWVIGKVTGEISAEVSLEWGE